MRLPGRLPIPPALAVSLLGLTAAAVCPSPAAAGCGDYVVYTNPAHGKSATDHMPAPAKCHGPNCSQAPPAAPMPQAPPAPRLFSDKSLPLSDGDSASPSKASDLGFAEAGGFPVRRPTDVFHPPR